MENTIIEILRRSASLKEQLATTPSSVAAILSSAKQLRTTINAGGTIYSCGNGGSTADCIHLTEELVARYKRERPGIRAMHFMDAATLTCWGNDYGFESAFARQAETFCTSKDTLIAISTSGNSKNVIAAVEVAKRKGCHVIGLLGKDGGLLGNQVDTPIIIPANETERVQECHITVIHLWCELIETSLK